MRTSLLIAAVIAVATIISANAANTRGALRSPGITNANDDHTDLVAGYDSSASASAVHAQMTDVEGVG